MNLCVCAILLLSQFAFSVDFRRSIDDVCGLGKNRRIIRKMMKFMENIYTYIEVEPIWPGHLQVMRENKQKVSQFCSFFFVVPSSDG